MMKLRNNQDGLVAIIVSIMFIIIISLVVTSFAFFMRREQQQVLDRQLSIQAFFAAESGVNDTIVDLIENPSEPTDPSQCDNPTPVTVGDSNAAYTCVIIDKEVTNIKYTDVPADESRLVRLTSNSPIYGVVVYWESVDSKGNFASNDTYNLPTNAFNLSQPNSFANHVAVIDTMIIPLNKISTVDRKAINDAAKSFYAYPIPLSLGVSTINYSDTKSDGAFVGGGCDATKADGRSLECSSIINNLGGKKDVVVRVKPLYKNAHITLVATDSAGNPVKLIGAQAEIDSTGRANDVLRRIQVRVPLQGKQDYFPEFVVETGDDICKLLRLQINAGKDLCKN